MKANRRLVLKGMALSGIAGLAIGNSKRTLASTVSPLSVLIGDDECGAMFLRGVSAAAGSALQVQSPDRDLRFMLEFERQLRRSHPMRIIGLLDDASGTLVFDLARSAGARVQWLGQHTAHAGHTQHRLLNADAGNCARRFARELYACGVGFHIFDEPHGNSASKREFSRPPRDGTRSAEWATGLGYLLASFDRQSMGAPVRAGDVAMNGRFVSFSFEV